jgi:hypothetical protein
MIIEADLSQLDVSQCEPLISSIGLLMPAFMQRNHKTKLIDAFHNFAKERKYN